MDPQIASQQVEELSATTGDSSLNTEDLNQLILPLESLELQEEELVGQVAKEAPEFLKVIDGAFRAEVNGETRLEIQKKQKEVLRDFRNCCGQYAAAVALSAIERPTKVIDLIKKHNAAGLFTSPQTMKKMLTFSKDKQTIQPKFYNYKRVAFSSEQAHTAASEHLVEFLKTGGSAVLLVGVETKNGASVPHWICVTGVEIGSDKKPVNWHISDAAGLADNTDYAGTITHSELLKLWKSPLQSKMATQELIEYKYSWFAVGGSEIDLKFSEKAKQALSNPIVSDALLYGADRTSQFIVNKSEEFASYLKRTREKRREAELKFLKLFERKNK